MGFKEAKSKVIACLNTGQISHEVRNEIDTKNLLSTGVVSASEVAKIIGRSRGDCYSSSPHHFDDTIDVHLIKTPVSGKIWYIKWYFAEPNSMFISVH
jgi:hypothetical protein